MMAPQQITTENPRMDHAGSVGSVGSVSNTGNAEQKKNPFSVNWFYCLRCLLAQFVLCPTGLLVLLVCGAVDKVPAPASLPLLALAAMITAPVFETFVFFFLPHRLFRHFIKNQVWVWGLSFVTTTVLFTLDHHTSGKDGIVPHRNWPVALNVGLTGSLCFFACYYLTTRSRRGSPFWTTTCCHALYNTGIFILMTAYTALTGVR